jgi:hypothetical protein
VTSYEFALRLNREVTDAEIEALYEAGCDDAGIETGPLGTLIQFDREAPSLAQAISTAARDIDKVPGLRAVGVACDNMVTMLDIAQRTCRSREAVRLWASGERGPGGFPSPEMITTGGEKVWDWEQVARWLGRHREEIDSMPGLAALHVLATADRVLAARAALRSEPDSEVREEFGRLLQDA